MRSGPVLGAWALGLLLAVAAVMLGPDRLLYALGDLATALGDAFERISLTLGARALALARGLAIGLFATFVVLCALAARRGRPAGTPLLVGAVLWLVLGSSADGDPGRWGMAMLLALVGALAMTRRVMERA